MTFWTKLFRSKSHSPGSGTVHLTTSSSGGSAVRESAAAPESTPATLQDRPPAGVGVTTNDFVRASLPPAPKRCAACGGEVEASRIECPQCGSGRFASEKVHSPSITGPRPRGVGSHPATGSPEQVRVCIIRDRSRDELWIVGDKFVPTEPIARRVAEREKFSGTIHTASANRSFEGTALENESFVAMFALIQMHAELQKIGYEFIALGERGALYACPRCGVLLKKNPAILDLSRAGSPIGGNAGCATCGAAFSMRDVFEGRYDL